MELGNENGTDRYVKRFDFFYNYLKRKYPQITFINTVQWHCETELLFDVPPSCFVPQPKVTSSVIRLRRRVAPPVPVRDEALMFRIIRAAFNQRRKTLVNAMCAGVEGLGKEQAEAVLLSCGLDPRIRGERVDIGGFAKIADQISEGNFPVL